MDRQQREKNTEKTRVPGVVMGHHALFCLNNRKLVIFAAAT
jgi:hypothetical protein